MAKFILIGCYGLIGWLLWKDMAWRKAGSWTLLIPGAWLFIQGSRAVSQWFGGKSGEPNPIDGLIYALLIGSAIVVVAKQGFRWIGLARQNQTLVLIYGFFLCSALWSEMPAATVKRLFKDFGCILVGLVFLIQRDPAAAIRAVYVRVAYALFSLSVVFIKYFPEIGRHSNRAGDNMFTGISTHKNSLGLTVFVFGIIVIWDLAAIWREPERKGRKMQIAIRVGMVLMALWLLEMCDSSTALLCLVLGVATFWACSRLIRMRNGKTVLYACLVTVVCLAAADKMLGLSNQVILMLGRNPTLTGRTTIWERVLDQKTDPLLGEGFYTFWSTKKGTAVVEDYMVINSAHNGYLEMYLDGGLVGDVLLGILLLAVGHRVINRIFAKHVLGPVGLIFWLLVIIYNLSESSFFRLDVLWSTFLLLIVACPQTRRQVLASQRLKEIQTGQAG